MDAADPIREKVRTTLSPVPLYPFQRFSSTANPLPQKHAQLYAGSEGPGRFPSEYTDVVYLNLFAAKESEVKAMREQVRFLDGYAAAQAGAAPEAGNWSYSLQSATKLEEGDGTMHFAILLQATYIRQVAYVA